MSDRFTKLTKTLNLPLQVIIFILSCWFIYKKVFHKGDIEQLSQDIMQRIEDPLFLMELVIVVLMMILNWSVETEKWRFLIGKVEKVGFFRAFQGVLAGVTISSILPNRTGEFLARIFVLNRTSRIEGILVTIIGSIGQIVVTLITGSVGLLFFLHRYVPDNPFFSGFFLGGIIAGVVLFDLLILGLYLKVDFLSVIRDKIFIGYLKRGRKFFRIFGYYHWKELVIALLFSFIRYLIFSTQFYLLLLMFDVRIYYPHAIMIISIIYFVMAIIPTITLTELGIRGSVSLFFFGLYFSAIGISGQVVNVGIFFASTLLWMINIGVPAALGAFFIFRLKFIRPQPTAEP